MDIDWTHPDEVRLNQTRLIEKLLLAHNMLTAKPITCPMNVTSDPKSDKQSISQDDMNNYRGIIGSILYLAVITSSDIGTTANIFAQFVKNPQAIHMKAAKRVLR